MIIARTNLTCKINRLYQKVHGRKISPSTSYKTQYDSNIQKHESAGNANIFPQCNNKFQVCIYTHFMNL